VDYTNDKILKEKEEEVCDFMGRIWLFFMWAFFRFCLQLRKMQEMVAKMQAQMQAQMVEQSKVANGNWAFGDVGKRDDFVLITFYSLRW
jgi:hypothetical protein